MSLGSHLALELAALLLGGAKLLQHLLRALLQLPILLCQLPAAQPVPAAIQAVTASPHQALSQNFAYCPLSGSSHNSKPLPKASHTVANASHKVKLSTRQLLTLDMTCSLLLMQAAPQSRPSHSHPLCKWLAHCCKRHLKVSHQTTGQAALDRSFFCPCMLHMILVSQSVSDQVRGAVLCVPCLVQYYKSMADSKSTYLSELAASSALTLLLSSLPSTDSASESNRSSR